MKITHLKDELGEFRVARSFPKDPKAICIFVQSGRMDAYDIMDADSEMELYAQLIVKNAAVNIASIQLDMPCRDIGKRTRRIHTVIGNLESSLPLIFIGVSMGCYSILELHSGALSFKNDSHIILTGCIPDETIHLNRNVKTAFLIYGADDYVAYSEDGSVPQEALRPCDYATAASEMVVLDNGKFPEVHIFEGCDHLLLNSHGAGTSSNTISRLSQFIEMAVAYE